MRGIEERIGIDDKIQEVVGVRIPSRASISVTCRLGSITRISVEGARDKEATAISDSVHDLMRKPDGAEQRCGA